MIESKAGAASGNVPQVQILEEGEHHVGQRLDNFLLGRLKGVPKTLIDRVIRKGEVRVDGKRAKPDTRLESGNKVRIPPLRMTETGEPVKPGAQLEEKLRAAVLMDDPG